MARWAAGRWLVGAGILGLLAGAFLYDLTLPTLETWGMFGTPQSMTLPVILELPYPALALVFGVAVLLMMALADRLDPGKRLDEPVPASEPWGSRLFRREWGWIPASLLTGGLILLATYQGEYLGIVSGVAALLAHVGEIVGYPFQSVGEVNAHTAWRGALVVGLIPGAFLSARLVPDKQSIGVSPLWAAVQGPSVAKRAVQIGLGGFLITYGGLLGGGCTTGAFMAGWPTLSVGNFAMGMTFFMTGMATAFLLYWGKWGRVREVRTAARLTLATD